MPRFLTPSVSRSKVFWMGLSGQSLELAAQNDEVNLYARYGALNLASMILATAIGFFFDYLAWAPPERPPLGPSQAAGGLRRWSPGGQGDPRDGSVRGRFGDPDRRRDGLSARLGNFFARGLATVALVLVGSWTLTPLLANGLVISYLQSHRHLVPTKSEQLALSSAQAALNDQRHTLAVDQHNLTTGQTELSAEEQGHGPSHIAGCGRACRADTVEVQNAQVQLDRDRARIAPLELALSRAQQAEARDLAGQEAKPIDADVFSRHAALSAMSGDSSVAWLDWLVTFLIGAIDLGPILMKTFSPQSATDEAVLHSAVDKRDEHEIASRFHLDAATAGAQETRPPRSTSARRSTPRLGSTRRRESGMRTTGRCESRG